MAPSRAPIVMGPNSTSSDVNAVREEQEPVAHDGMQAWRGDADDGFADAWDHDPGQLFAAANLQAAPGEQGREYRRQAAYVATFKGLVASKSPLAILRRPGSSYNAAASVDLGVDVIASALTAAAHGIPVPSSLLASLTPGLKLQVSGSLSAGDTGKIGANLTLSLTVGIDAGAGAGFAASAGAHVGQSLSVKGSFDSLEHFVAYYLRKLTRWLQPLAGRGYRDRDTGQDLESYRRLLDLGRRRRTRVVGLQLSGGFEAEALSLFGAGVEASIMGTRATRKRSATGRGSMRHEYKHGYVVEASASVHAGPLEGTGTVSVIHNDANPDNDGIYITLTLVGGANGVLSLVQAAPQQLATIAFEAGGTMDALSGTLSGALSLANLPIGGARLGVHMDTQATLVWFQPGQTKTLPGGHGSVLLPEGRNFRLLYARMTDEIGADLGASGIPVYGGLTAGFGFSGSASRTRKEHLGHDSIAYVQSLYLGMRGHRRSPWASADAPRKNDWTHWEQKHRGDLMRMMESDNVRRELTVLAGDLEVAGTVQGARDVLDLAYAGNDFERWLLVVKWLFNSEAHHRAGEGGVSHGFTKYAAPKDMFDVVVNRGSGWIRNLRDRMG